jgi:hypothetical protein
LPPDHGIVGAEADQRVGQALHWREVALAAQRLQHLFGHVGRHGSGTRAQARDQLVACGVQRIALAGGCRGQHLGDQGFEIGGSHGLCVRGPA